MKISPRAKGDDMDKTERARIAKLNELRFSNLGNITLKSAVEAKQAYKKALATLAQQKDTYNPEYIAEQTKKIKRDYAAKLASIHAEIAPKLDELQASIEEMQKDFVIDEAWLGTLQTLQMGGKSLDGETIRMLNANFAGDQPRLRALQKVYKEQGLSYDGGIDKMVYSIGDTFNQLKRSAEATFLRGEASINSFASAVAKIANFEGSQFEANPDPDGFSEASRKGAGLDE